VHLGLVVEREGGRLELVLVVILPVSCDYTFPSVPGFRARHARNKHH
jgi:hypothetical protein